MNILETDRLSLREFEATDAPFVLEQVTDPGWLRFIGDRGVHNLDDARAYIDTVPRAMYARNGFGLWLVTLKDGTPIGMCGLIQRPGLADVDLGYALLPRFAGQGYAREAATAVLARGRDVHHLKRIVAITSLDNDRSIHLLTALGFRLEGQTTLPNDDEPLNLFAIEFAP